MLGGCNCMLYVCAFAVTSQKEEEKRRVDCYVVQCPHVTLRAGLSFIVIKLFTYRKTKMTVIGCGSPPVPLWVGMFESLFEATGYWKISESVAHNHACAANTVLKTCESTQVGRKVAQHFLFIFHGQNHFELKVQNIFRSPVSCSSSRNALVKLPDVIDLEIIKWGFLSKCVQQLVANCVTDQSVLRR